MDSVSYSIRIFIAGIQGQYGSIGLYGALQQLFTAFGLLSLPACFLIDAPFGRFSTTSLSLPGNAAWLVMEIVSPLALLWGLSLPFSSTQILLSMPNWENCSALVDKVAALPQARQILIGLYLVHYANRAVIGTLRNPSRAPLHLSVFLSAVGFNLINGLSIGIWLCGGGSPASIPSPGSPSSSFGTQLIELTGTPTPLYWVGISLFVLGFAGNIYSDEILYSLKRSLLSRSTPSSSGPKSRYAIPQGFLYSAPFGGISNPSYLCEWLEWAGFNIACSALQPGMFPVFAWEGERNWGQRVWDTVRRDPSRLLVDRVPSGLRPRREWWLQAPMVFLLNEVAAMLPRAISGHAWYKKTFSDFPKERKIVIPGIF